MTQSAGDPPGVPSTPTEGLPEGLLAPGQVLGDRYQIRSRLGRGGMGEVWRAFDLKLRVEVALKALREELFRSERRLELLRQEVRAAREVMSPNVCRIFDLIEVDGRELVSMEFVDGQTLLAVFQERGPLELKEAQDVASQFLAGLEAIHGAGLVHRDVKPENIMLTRAGRVVVMDFGLARQEAEGGGSVSGTPAYMAPEQARGEAVDARADVYAAGVVLAEMVSPGGIKDLVSRQSVWEGIRHEPAKVPDTPWSPVLKKAVAKEPDQRYNSAHTLTRALEDVTLRVEGAEDLTPYPGLASFTEDDADYFFGRESEVERLWRRLDRPRLLAIVGPSGSGKTSFIGAGLIASATSKWGIVRCTPGDAALASLRRALASEISDDAVAVGELAVGDAAATVSAYSRWRARHEQALLVVDQFEELFTLGSVDEQRGFTELVARLPLEADAFVLLSMRDDFLLRCREHEVLEPVFTDLTALLAPKGAALRRAVVQPAVRCGYRFEDDDLIDQMLAEVEGERGALPLLAFALARLWEERDRDSGLLTRQAYDDIGGVGGALARHAEATVDRVGADRIAIVRELFRNLVTAEGTRAVREWGELLSVFEESQRESAEEVLRELVDARLLTSYEVREEDREPTHRVEIIHESLLANWPRLVRWQTQDADAVQLRDQLRQAAKTWDEHDRSDDLLWTGPVYREFALWRERYSGGLSEVEDDFASAMTSYANRRRRRRRVAAAVTVVFLSVVATVLGALWRRSALETRRAEAQKLVAIARLELGRFPTGALAHATASLEVYDTEEARLLAVEALWKGPTVFVLSVGPDLSDVMNLAFSPDGRLLAAAAPVSTEVCVWSETGEVLKILGDKTTPALAHDVGFSRAGDVLVSCGGDACRLWSVPDYELIRELDLTEGSRNEHQQVIETLIACDGIFTWHRRDRRKSVQWWPLDGGPPVTLGSWLREEVRVWSIDATCEFLLFARGRDVLVRPLVAPQSPENDRLVGRHPDEVSRMTSQWTAGFLASRDVSGETRLWSLDSDPEHPLRKMHGPAFDVTLGPDASFLIDTPREPGEGRGGYRLWDLTGPPDTGPLLVTEPPGSTPWRWAFHPSGRWLAESASDRVHLWPLKAPVPHVLEGPKGPTVAVAFTADGKYLLTAAIFDECVRLWPLSAESGEHARVLWKRHGLSYLAPDASGRQLLVSKIRSAPRGAFLVPMTGDQSAVKNLWPEDTSLVIAVRFSEDGHQAAAAAAGGVRDEDMVIRIWDLELGDEQVLALRDDSSGGGHGFWHRGVGFMRFAPGGALLSGGSGGLRRWDLETGTAQWLYRVADPYWVRTAASRDARFVLTAEIDAPGADQASDLTIHDLEHGTSRPILTHGHTINQLAIDWTGAIIATSQEGVVRVGPADGSEPYLLFGHEGDVKAIAISPDGRWIASGGEDYKVRLWPMPDLSKPPLHTLPREELIAKLETLTNLRVVRDEESSTGWKLEIGPFPGWADVPEW